MDDLASQFFWEQFFLFLPLGLIGAWRWGVWLFQKFFARRYRPLAPNRSSRRFSLSVVTPVYNEDPVLFRQALDSWKNNDVTEIIAVVDHTDQACARVFKNFQKNYPTGRLIVTHEPGKRPALAWGTRESQGEIIALVDSDTRWDPDIRDALLTPFLDDRVGGVTCTQAVLDPKTPAEKLFAMRLNMRYRHEFPYLASVGFALNCLSGRTAVYRRSALFPLLNALVNETYLWKKCISGEDKRLTSLVMKNGWQVRFQQNATVRTQGMPHLKQFFKQNLRWARNSWRTDLQVMFQGWVWRREPLFGYHLIDRAIQPFTLLLGPIYFVIALYYHYYLVAVILFAWWLGSRSTRLLPHLRHEPRDILRVPLFTYAQFHLAIIKIYALLTHDFQSWITRWDANRLRLGKLALLPSQVATFAIITGLAFLVFEHTSLAVRKEDSPTRGPVYLSTLPGLSLAEKEADFWKKREENQVGRYRVRFGDTPRSLVQLFALPETAYQTLFADLAPTAFLSPGRDITIPMASLEPVETPLAPVRRSLPQVTYDPASRTIHVKGAGNIMTLDEIATLLPAVSTESLLEEVAPHEWLLRANLRIGANTTLLIDGNRVAWLKIASSSQGFSYLMSYNGRLFFQNTKITSWDEEAGAPDTVLEDGRALVVAYASGRLDITSSEMAYLGYPLVVARAFGSFGGTYGVAWKIPNGSLNTHLLTGSVIDSRIHDNYFGLYSFGATGLLIQGNEIYNNIEYGIDPHDDSNNLLIDGNYVHHNGNHGIIGSKRVVYSTIRNNQSFNNRLHGLMLDRESNYNLVENNFSSENNNGLALYDSHHNLVRTNSFHDNRYGIRANMNSSENRFDSNSIENNERGIFIYGNAQKNVIIDNAILHNELGIALKETRLNVVIRSLKSKANPVNLKVDEHSRFANLIERIP